jgi:hypothetical protein
MSDGGIHIEGARAYRGCTFCGGRGCLACAQQSKRDQQASFENPVFTWNPKDPEDAKRLRTVMDSILGTGWQQRGVMVAMHEPVNAPAGDKVAVYDPEIGEECPLRSCSNKEMHSHPVCPDCGAVAFQNLACATCRQQLRQDAQTSGAMFVETLDALGIDTVVPVSSVLPAAKDDGTSDGPEAPAE